MLHDDVWQVYEIISAPFRFRSQRRARLQAEMVVVLDQNNLVYRVNRA